MTDTHTPIPGWEGYEASEDGRVFSASNWRGYGLRELQQTPNSDGYPSVRLNRADGARVRMAVHRLIASTFLPERPSPEHQLRHLDGNKAHNTPENLRWGTAAENAADREQHGHTSRGATHSAAIRRGLVGSHG